MSSERMPINLTQLILTFRISEAVKKIDPNKKITNLLVDDGTFRLSRMDNMMSLDFETLIVSEPIQIRKAVSYDGTAREIVIDGVSLPLYTIVNGRHRVVRALVEDRRTINAVIV